MLTALAITLMSAAPAQAQLDAMGRDLQFNYERGIDGLTPLIDMNLLIDRTLAGVGAPPDYKKGFAIGFREQAGMWGAGLLAQVKRGGRVTYRKTVKLDGKPALRVRLLNDDGSFNFFDLLIEPNAAGELRVADVFDLLAGELKSKEIRRMALSSLADVRGDLTDKLKDEQVFLHNLPALKAMTSAMREQKYAEVLDAFAKLPRPLQDQRTYLRMAALAALKVDPLKYEQAMKRYLQLYPNDASSRMMGIDFYFHQKKWADVERSITLVEKHVGTDEAWFEVLRAKAAEQQGKRELAKKHLLKAIAREKTLSDPYLMLLGFSLMEKRYADTVKWLDAVQKDAGVELKDVTTVPQYKDFVESKEGKAWVAQQAAAKGN